MTTQMTYLTGVTFEASEAVRRSDFGLLATPDSATGARREHYDVWAADNAFFAAPRPDGEGHEPVQLGGFHASATAAQVRYAEPAQAKCDRWITWLEQQPIDGCLFATLPDVVGDYKATWERSARYIARVRALGFKVAIVLQDGVEHDRFVWASILNAADAVFIGGSTEWKLSPAVAQLVAEAKARGLWVHMGRVNSYKRIAYAAGIGCDSADGTYLKFGKKADRVANVDVVCSWLNRVNGTLPLPLTAAQAAAA